MDFHRFRRQMAFFPGGEADQKKLSRARVAVVGLGALGSHMAEFLVRSGVGLVRLIDDDVIEASNLQRQTLYAEMDVGHPKVRVAGRRLREIYAACEIEEVFARCGEENGRHLLQQVDLVLDATDTFTSRFCLNRMCLQSGQPWIHTGVTAGVGQSFLIVPGKTACFRCLVPEDPSANELPTVASHGILQTVVAGLAGIAVTQAWKVLLGLTPAEALLFYDVWEHRLEHIRIQRDPTCPDCAHLP